MDIFKNFTSDSRPHESSIQGYLNCKPRRGDGTQTGIKPVGCNPCTIDSPQPKPRWGDGAVVPQPSVTPTEFILVSACVSGVKPVGQALKQRSLCEAERKRKSLTRRGSKARRAICQPSAQRWV